MFESFQIAVVSSSTGYKGLNTYACSNSAFSGDAQDVIKAAQNIIRHAGGSSQILTEWKKESFIAQLRALANDCFEENWDGNGAYAIAPLSLRNAEDFIRALPDNCPMPEYAPEPNGSISLDWIQSRHRLFSISIGCENRIAYAWVDGIDTGYGVAQFNGFSMPQRVFSGIQSIIQGSGNGHPSFRII